MDALCTQAGTYQVRVAKGGSQENLTRLDLTVNSVEWRNRLVLGKRGWGLSTEYEVYPHALIILPEISVQLGYGYG